MKVVFVFIVNGCCVDYNFLYCVVLGTQCDVFSKDGVNFTLHLIPLNLLLENTGSVLLDVMGKEMTALSLLDFSMLRIIPPTCRRSEDIIMVTVRPVTGRTATQICTLTHLMNISYCINNNK